MTANRLTVSESVRRDTVRSVSKLLLAAVSLVFVLYLLTLLPGVDRLVPLTPVTFAAVVGAIATVVLVALILYATPKLASLTRMRLEGPEAVVENVASVVYWLGILAAVLVAHRGLAGALTPFMEGFTWIYDVAFLLLSLPAVAVIAARLYVSIDPSADLLADRVVDCDDSTDERSSNDPSVGRERAEPDRSPNGE